ncbi:MAG: phenylacetate--CoA ligase family protein [Kiloniellaceae bacterium]
MDTHYFDPFMETLDRESLARIQLQRFREAASQVLGGNAFYRAKFRKAGLENAADLRTFDDFRRLPFTLRSELSEDQAAHPPYGTNLSFPRARYTRIHETSGTTGRALLWLDTDESWSWWLRCWAAVYQAAGVTAGDRIFYAFSFGPFIGLWSAFEAARTVGALAVPGGGMSSHQRAKAILAHDITVLVCTPTYAMHLAEVAEQDGIDMANCKVKRTIHAGEPGASLPGTKQRIEGAWGFECGKSPGLHINEGEFICEVIDPATGQAAAEGELVVTNLGRAGMPIIRYRTGDKVSIAPSPCPCGRSFLRFEGGVIGRMDDALVVRGINVFPSAIENIVRRFPEVGEFAVHVHRRKEMDELEVQIETRAAEPERIAAALGREIHAALGLRARVAPAAFGSLPRFDLKAKRFTDHRKAAK